MKKKEDNINVYYQISIPHQKTNLKKNGKIIWKNYEKIITKNEYLDYQKSIDSSKFKIIKSINDETEFKVINLQTRDTFNCYFLKRNELYLFSSSITFKNYLTKISKIKHQKINKITCKDNSCIGTYTGPEFINGKDIAHQFSNKMSKQVGDKLKEFYKEENYKKVNFSSIKMQTKGMGSGHVEYSLEIPFIDVDTKCDAYTSFDHVGGWNHKPTIERRKKELKNVTLKGHTLNISELIKTPEGLQEYWIQWKNKILQADCD